MSYGGSRILSKGGPDKSSEKSAHHSNFLYLDIWWSFKEGTLAALPPPPPPQSAHDEGEAG